MYVTLNKIINRQILTLYNIITLARGSSEAVYRDYEMDFCAFDKLWHLADF